MVLLGLSARLEAQETMPAVNLSRESLSGYTTAGVGWSFVPATDIIVTGIFSTAPQVDFWQGSNQVIATYYYAGSPFQGSTNFQPVQPLHLTARKTYFISTQQTNFSSIVLELIYGLGAINDNSTTFTPSPYIQQFASYYLSTNLLWSSPAGWNDTGLQQSNFGCRRRISGRTQLLDACNRGQLFRPVARWNYLVSNLRHKRRLHWSNKHYPSLSAINHLLESGFEFLSEHL